MRHLSIVLVLLGLPAMAAAQHPRPRATTHSPAPTTPPAPTGSALGSIGLPLTSIGLPLPSIGLAPWTLGLSPVPLGVTQPAPEFLPGQRNQPGRRHRPRSPVIYVVPSYGWGVAPSWQTATPEAPVVTPYPPKPETGRLRFEVEPSDVLQVLVDGVYLGTPSDLGHEVEMKPGSRRMEFRAPGYETLVVDVQIVAGRVITYRGTLNLFPRTEPPAPPVSEPPPPAVPAGITTLYVIPGCYLGNVRPQEVRLPPGCDLSRLSIRTP